MSKESKAFFTDRYFKLRGDGCKHKEAIEIARAYTTKVYGSAIAGTLKAKDIKEYTGVDWDAELEQEDEV